MFAVVKTGGKQYTVKKDDIIRVEKLEGKEGDKIALGEVLMLGGASPKLGSAAKVAGVTAEIVEQGKGDKVIVFKKKRRQNYRRKNGHRQPFTALKIVDIKG